MESGDAVAFARIGDPVVAIGRAVVTGDWMGLQGVEVAADHRGQGLATRVVDALLDWGASKGALSAYLQTVADNVAALRLYGRYGFVTHHAYRYLTSALRPSSSGSRRRRRTWRGVRSLRLWPYPSGRG